MRWRWAQWPCTALAYVPSIFTCPSSVLILELKVKLGAFVICFSYERLWCSSLFHWPLNICWIRIYFTSTQGRCEILFTTVYPPQVSWDIHLLTNLKGNINSKVGYSSTNLAWIWLVYSYLGVLLLTTTPWRHLEGKEDIPNHMVVLGTLRLTWSRIYYSFDPLHVQKYFARGMNRSRTYLIEPKIC